MSVRSINNLLHELNNRFSALSDSPSLDAQVLLAHLIHQPRTWVLAHPEFELSVDECHALKCAVEKIESGTPLPYIIGTWEFYNRKFYINPDVLIPRPETELLVEKALDWIAIRLSNKPNENLLVADIGCGSGCIAISLAIAHHDLHGFASDVSYSALRVALKNTTYHSVTSRIQLLQCDLLPPIFKPFDLICANLPYIPTQTLAQLKIYQKEPTQALDGGLDGLDFIKQLIFKSPKRLATDGLMLLEIGATQGESVKQLARVAFPDASIELYQDLSGHDRLISIQQG
jgi:release factor glutamine methyltransferase